jgi:hypothetical protein
MKRVSDYHFPENISLGEYEREKKTTKTQSGLRHKGHKERGGASSSAAGSRRADCEKLHLIALGL